MDFVDDEKKYFLEVYRRYPVCFERGEGQYLWDTNGKKYIDFLSGIAVCAFGHSNKVINDAIKDQVSKLIHVSNLFYTKPQIELGRKLSEIFGGGKVFLSNSGTEANECAIKFARKWGKSIDDDKYEIITLKNSFHGRTLGALSATGQHDLYKGYEPLLDGFKCVEPNDFESIESLCTKNTCAVMIEVIQGEGGVKVLDKEFVKNVYNLCKDNKVLLILDEIQTGMGRTGKFFCFEYYGIEPDVVTLAKGLGAGLPIGATIVNKKFEDVFSYGDHGSTFGGNIVSARAAVEVLNLLDESKLKYISEIGSYFLGKLLELKNKYSFIKDVRGMGLMLAIEVDFDARDLVAECLSEGIILNVTQKNVIRFLPSYVIIKSDIDELIRVLNKIWS